MVLSNLYVPGAVFMDERDVPHGAVSEVLYRSTVLGKFRSMHIYTPPGCERDAEKYPVLYFHHGANESDDSWHSVGRAGFILDNLIADGKAVPMIIVMPNGHTDQIPPVLGPPSTRRAASASAHGQVSWRIRHRHHALCGGPLPRHRRPCSSRHRRLVHGGSQSLNIAFAHLDRFSSIGVRVW